MIKLFIQRVAKQLMVSKTAVHIAITNFYLDGFEDRKRSGLPRVTSNSDNDFIGKMVT